MKVRILFNSFCIMYNSRLVQQIMTVATFLQLLSSFSRAFLVLLCQTIPGWNFLLKTIPSDWDLSSVNISKRVRFSCYENWLHPSWACSKTTDFNGLWIHLIEKTQNRPFSLSTGVARIGQVVILTPLYIDSLWALQEKDYLKIRIPSYLDFIFLRCVHSCFIRIIFSRVCTLKYACKSCL